METTRLSAKSWGAKHAHCPHCGASLGPDEAIDSRTRLGESKTIELHKVVQCAVCRKQSRVVVAV